MKKVLITQSNYIPWKGYFDAINFADEFIIYDDVQYTRRDWRNRNKIKTPQGAQWLTTPVDVKGKYLQKIRDTQVVNDENWRETHWKTILTNYSNAPYFKTYKDLFQEAYLGNSEMFLSKINFTFITLINKILNITTPIRWSNDFTLAEGRNERLADLCKQVNATDYYSGPAAKDYMDVDIFNKQGINVHYFDYSGYPLYNQLYGDFIHEVSILDLIFNEGPNAQNFMKSFSGKPMLQSTDISATL